MSDQEKPETTEAREAEAAGEKPDLGHKPDALTEALTGTNVGSDTRAGSLRGGSASGSDVDPDQEAIDESLATEGMKSAAPKPPTASDRGPTVNNTGDDLSGPAGDPAEGKPGIGDEADAATG